jgi:macrolide transport system ATP-binding/permease protein
MLSLAIACVGLYGTTSYTLARRTGEIGIRMALGAQRATVVWMVLRDVLMLAIMGLVIGVPAALSASKLIGSLLFGVKPGDLGALAAALAILLSAALVAGYLPARKRLGQTPWLRSAMSNSLSPGRPTTNAPEPRHMRPPPPLPECQ